MRKIPFTLVMLGAACASAAVARADDVAAQTAAAPVAAAVRQEAPLPEWAKTSPRADLLRAETKEIVRRTAADDERARADTELDLLDRIATAPDASAAIEAYSKAKCVVRRQPLAAKAFVARMTELDLPDLAVTQAKEVVGVELDEPLARAVIATGRAREGDAEGAMVAISRAVMHDAANPFVRRTAGRIAAWRDTRTEGRMAADVELTFRRTRDTVGTTKEYAAAYEAAVAAYAAERAAAASPAPAATPAAAVTKPTALIPDRVTPAYRSDGSDDRNVYYGTNPYDRAPYVIVQWGRPSCGSYARTCSPRHAPATYSYASCAPRTSGFRGSYRSAGGWRSGRSSRGYGGRHGWR